MPIDIVKINRLFALHIYHRPIGYSDENFHTKCDLEQYLSSKIESK